MTVDPAEDEIGEPGVDVTDLLVATYRAGRRTAFAEAAEMVEAMSQKLLSDERVMGGARVAFDIAFRTLSLMFRRRADPDAKVADPDPGVVGDE